MTRKKPEVRITILKTDSNKELYDIYVKDLAPVCPIFREGQQFVSKDLFMPEGFCDWAWADIQRDVAVLCSGGDYPWIKLEGATVACCTDAFRPVTFLIERINN